MQSSQNIPLPLRMYPPFQQMYICATLPEYTPPYQNTPPFQQLNATLPESTPPFVRQLYAPFRLRIYPSSPLYNYIRYSKNIPLSH